VPRLWKISYRAGARIQGAPYGHQERPHRQTVISLDYLFHAVRAEILFRMAADAAYFNPPDKLARAATALRYTPCPTLEQIRMVLDAMPASTHIECRDRALIAFTIATGARDRAIISAKIKHVDLDHGRFDQDARQAGTKRAKTFSTWFFPVGEKIYEIIADWLMLLRGEIGFSLEDPIFPKARVGPGADLKFRAAGLDRAHWSNTNPVREIFRNAFRRVGLPYFNPHSFRNTLVHLAYDLKLDPERFRAWSQNLGHENCLTTFSSYGTLLPTRQGELSESLPPGGRERRAKSSITLAR
jgi:integrase